MVARPVNSGSIGQGLTPLTNRGGVTSPISCLGELQAYALDAITLTCGPEHYDEVVVWAQRAAEQLRATFEISPPATARWFHSVQRWTLTTLTNGGGELFSRIDERRQPKGTQSAKWGKSAINFDVTGSSTGPFASELARIAGRLVEPSRLDVCFDFECEPEVFPAQVAKELGLKPEEYEVRGNGQTHSVYAPAGKSTRSRIIIYRKDLEQRDRAHQRGDFSAPVGPPKMRIEVKAMDDLAPSWWRVSIEQGREGLVSAAIAELRHRIGLELEPGGPTQERPVQKEPSHLVSALLSHVDREGLLATILEDHGISTRGLKVKLDELRGHGVDVSRMTSWRAKQRSREADRWKDAGADLEAAILALAAERFGDRTQSN